MSRHISSLLRSIVIFTLLAGQLALPTGSVLAAAGDLDSTFSSDGYLISTDGSDGIRPNTFFKDILVLPGGKILTGGNSMDNAYHQGEVILEQYNPDGTLDTSFSGDGWTTTSFGDGWFEMYAIEQLSDGRIVAAGTYFYMIGAEMYREFALARYCPDGSLDTGANCPALQPKFGANGTVTTTFDADFIKTNVLQSMVLQPDGKILTAGYVQESSSSIMAMARYNSDGTLDTSFGGFGSGMLILDLAGTGTDSSQIYSLALRPDGRIIAGGYTTDPATWETMFALVQFCPDGSLDDGSSCGFSGFGAGGIVITYNPDPVNYYDLYLRKIVLQADGSIIAAGYRTNESYVNGYALAKYQPNGDLDPGFGTNGMVFATVDAEYSNDSIYALTVQPDGKILVGGRNYTEGGESRFAIARYSANGNLDASFSTDGVVLENLGSEYTDSTISALEMDGSGNLLAAGSAKDAVSSKALLLRFTTTSDSTPPSIAGVSIPNVPMRVGDTVTATVTVDSDADTYALVSGTIGGFSLGSLNKVSDTTYTAQFTVTNGGTDVLASAGIPVSLVLRDTAGNQNAPYTTAISQGGDPIDANKPEIGAVTMSAASDSGVSNSDLITKVTTPTFNGTAEANSTVSVYVDGGLVTTTTANGAGAWTHTLVTALGEGARTIQATATDAAGNTSGFSTTFITIDATPPAAAVVTAPADRSTTKLKTPAISGTAVANEMVTVLIDGSTVGTTSANGSGNWSFATITPLPDGSHTAKATVTDAAGNTSTESNTNTFVVDLTLPAAPVVSTPANGSITKDAAPTVRGTAEANSTMTVLVDGNPVGMTTVDGSGNWSFTLGSPLADGSHTVSATATDAAGNTGPQSSFVTFTVDTSAPSAPLISTPANASFTSDPTPAISGTAEANSTVTVLVDGSQAGTAPVNGSGNWSFTPLTPLAEGSHTLRAHATDAAGNTGSDSAAVTFTVDTERPLGPIVLSSADGSSTNDTTPMLSGTAEANSTVTVYLDDVLIGTVITGGDGAWACTTDILAQGSHTVEVFTTDRAGNTSATAASLTLIVDTTAPAAPAIVSPENGSRTNDDTPVISGTAEANSTVEIFIDGSSAGTTTADVSGNWSFMSLHMTDNSHTIRATAVDSAGNTSSLSSATIFTVDTSAPAAPVITTPANGSSTLDITPTISGTAEIGSTVTVSIDGISAGTTTPDGSGAWTFIPGSALPDGSHTVSAAATDAANNTGASSAAITFTVDTTAPAAPVVLTPANGSVTGDSTPTVTGTADPGTTVTVLVDGDSVGTTPADGAGNWSYTLGTALSEGSHTVKATAADALGNTSVDSNTNTFTVDLTAPAAPGVSAPANGSITNDATPTVSGTAEANSTVTVLVDGTPVGTTTADGSGNWSFTQPVPLASAAHTVKATATDAAGNTGPQSSANAFTVDTSAPSAPSITAPANGSFTSDTTPAVSGTAEANSTVTIFIDGSQASTAPVNGSGNWSFTPLTPLAEGSHTVRANATDAAGNTGSDSAAVTFTVDTERPLGPVVLSPEDNSSTNDTTPTLSGTAEANSTVTVYLDDVLIGTATAGGDGAWTFTTAALGNGSHSIEMTATDRAGNTSLTAASLTLIVDTTAPAAPVIASPADGSSTNDPTPTISGTVEAYTTVTVTIDAAEAGTAAANDLGQWAFTPSTDLSEGDHTVSATATDGAANTGPASSASTFTIDLTDPEVELPPAPEPLDDTGTEPYLVTLTFTDDQGIDPASLGDGDVALTGPDFVLEGTFVSSTPSGAGYTVTYRLDPPALGWGSLPGGTFTVALVPNQVRDLGGNYLAAQTVTTVERPYLLFVPIFYPIQ